MKLEAALNVATFIILVLALNALGLFWLNDSQSFMPLIIPGLAFAFACLAWLPKDHKRAWQAPLFILLGSVLSYGAAWAVAMHFDAPIAIQDQSQLKPFSYVLAGATGASITTAVFMAFTIIPRRLAWFALSVALGTALGYVFQVVSSIRPLGSAYGATELPWVLAHSAWQVGMGLWFFWLSLRRKSVPPHP
jgi:hypothetical protein